MAGGPTPSPELLKKLESRWPATRSALVTHLVRPPMLYWSLRVHDISMPVCQEQFELHLADGRNWLFSTETPSYADISAHMSLGWVRSMKSVNEVFDKASFPKTIAVRKVYFQTETPDAETLSSGLIVSTRSLPARRNP